MMLPTLSWTQQVSCADFKVRLSQLLVHLQPRGELMLNCCCSSISRDMLRLLCSSFSISVQEIGSPITTLHAGHPSCRGISEQCLASMPYFSHLQGCTFLAVCCCQSVDAFCQLLCFYKRKQNRTCLTFHQAIALSASLSLSSKALSHSAGVDKPPQLLPNP